MCEFCTKHGEGEKWYLQMRNYARELLQEELSASQKQATRAQTRLEWTNRFWQGSVMPAITGVVSPTQPGALAWDNITVTTDDVPRRVAAMFHNAIGAYRSRMWETINPLYWIESVINLPKLALTHLGVPAESVIVKISQLLYWLVAAAVGFLYAVYKTEIDELVKAWLAGFAP